MDLTILEIEEFKNGILYSELFMRKLSMSREDFLPSSVFPRLYGSSACFPIFLFSASGFLAL